MIMALPRTAINEDSFQPFNNNSTVASQLTDATVLLQESDLDDERARDNPAYDSSGSESDSVMANGGGYGTKIPPAEDATSKISQAPSVKQKQLKKDKKGKKKNKTKKKKDDDEPDPVQDEPENIKPKKMWNVFQENFEDVQLYGCETCFERGTILIKLVFIIGAFSAILLGGVTSKLSLLFIANNANVKVAFHRTRENTSSEVNEPYPFACTDGTDGEWCTDDTRSCGIPLCLNTEEERAISAIRWIWALFLCLVTPYVITFFRNVWKICFKKKRGPESCSMVIFVCTMETLHSVGMFLLLFAVLPYIDAYRGIFLMNGVFIIPAILMVFLFPKNPHTSEYNKSTGAIIGDCVNVVLQMGAAAIWVVSPVVNEAADPVCTGPYDVPVTGESGRYDAYIGGILQQKIEQPNIFLIPVALFLTSFVYWDNFVDPSLGLGGLGDFLYKMHKQVKQCKTKLFTIVVFWKIIISFGMLMIYWFILTVTEFDGTNVQFADLFDVNRTNFYSPYTGELYTDWLIMYGIQVLMGLILFWVSETVIKANVQEGAFSSSLILITPLSFGILSAMCHECGTIGGSLTFNDFYWNCFGGRDNMMALITETWFVAGFIFWVSQFILGRHIWNPKIERLAKADRIFMTPSYCGCLLEQSLMFNRRRNDEEFKKKNINKLPIYQHRNVESEEQRENPDPLFEKANDDCEPFIFCCATMWHENEAEMINILKSIYRLDFDQKARATAQDNFKIVDPDFYKFEAHVLFDDAFNPHNIGEAEYTVNDFVKLLYKVMNVAAKAVHKVAIRIDDPEKYPTPYGGRLVYRLPGDNSLIVHMKDKQKIRHRKRWSQVMYMYYMLGYRLWSEQEKRGRKEIIAHNTYLLALDGDVDFKPEAVILLVDLMKRNAKVGAACGRIHPMGSGPMIWYQQFEYAVSHWLQKSTEHVLGCVLCSPGCFSLFRGSAIMDNNVMKTYSKKPVTASDHVQYDQGEDRWLCTLLLQQGYRVEYAAASDAMTFAPEGFDEFFNQRKRWTPSTFANILDLLKSGRKTVKHNENISMLYIVYQTVLFGASIIGPATIFLLISGAIETTTGLQQGYCFLIVFIPIGGFFILTLTAKTSTQLFVALILAGLLMAVMMIVIITVIIAIFAEGLCDPDSIFMIFILFVFVLAAILHPQEGITLIYLPLYFLAIPTMYLLLIIYSMCNMHDVSWGTREVPKTAAEKLKDEQISQEYSAKEAAENNQPNKPTQSGIMAMFGMGGTETKGDKDGWTMAMGDCCSFTCCLRPGKSITDDKIDKLAEEVKVLHTAFNRVNNPRTVQFEDDDVGPSTGRKQSLRGSVRVTDKKILAKLEEERLQEEEREKKENDRKLQKMVEEDERRDMDKPHWIQDKDLGKGPKRELSPGEINFWKGFIEEYLLPLTLSKDKKDKLAKELKELRNQTVAGFFIIDGLLIVFIEALYLSIDTGTGAGLLIAYNCTDPMSGTQGTYFLEPIGMLFIFVFGFVIGIQMVGMIVHRWFSLLQIVSTTKLSRPKHLDETTVDGMIKLVKQMQALPMDEDNVDTGSTGSGIDGMTMDIPDEEEEDDQYEDDNVRPQEAAMRKSVKRGLNNRTTMRRTPVGPSTIKTLDQAFALRFMALKRELDHEIHPQSNDLYASIDLTADNEEGPSSRGGAPNGGFRRGNIMKKTWKDKIPGKSILRRNKSIHHTTIMGLARNDVFSDENTNRLQTKYNIKNQDVRASILNQELQEAVEEARTRSMYEQEQYSEPYENIEMRTRGDNATGF